MTRRVTNNVNHLRKLARRNKKRKRKNALPSMQRVVNVCKHHGVINLDRLNTLAGDAPAVKGKVTRLHKKLINGLNRLKLGNRFCPEKEPRMFKKKQKDLEHIAEWLKEMGIELENA